MLAKEILIQTEKGETQVAIVENGRIDDFYIEVEHYHSLLGNIYKGRVESILPSINAAFVNIGQPRNGFLYLTDVVNPVMAEPLIESETMPSPRRLFDMLFRRVPSEEPPPPKATPSPNKTGKKEELPLKIGQEVLVQVVKDPFGEKGARLTTHLALPGRFVVYMPFDEQGGVSRKIDSVEERKRLREIIESFTFAKSGGFIIRTASLEQGKRELVRDAKFLYDMWVKIYKKAEASKAATLIYEEGELMWKIVRDYLTEKIDKVVIDSEVEHSRICKFVQTLIGDSMVDRIEYYQGQTPLFEARKISKELQSIYDTHVHVKTGAYIVIEPTEGLTVVDVNSGKFKTHASPGDAAYMVNMEVVPEIARQLRLRDLGGIIVIDFIDMVREEHKRRVVEALKRALTRDPAKTEVGRISHLGLVELTRARTGKTIESVSFSPCPFCDGRGRVKHV